MRDYWTTLGKSFYARRFMKAIGIPSLLSQELVRMEGAAVERSLQDMDIAFGTCGGREVTEHLARTLHAAGVNAFVSGGPAALEAFRSAGALSAQALEVDEASLGSRELKALVFDASGVTTVEGLRSVYDFFHPLMGTLQLCGRIVVVGRPPEDVADAECAAAQTALEGFVRSLSKEVGRRGVTAHLLYVSEGAEDRLAAPLRYFLGPQSAYCTGQPIRITGLAQGLTETTAWTRPLDGQVALVTGAARGIGEATARCLAKEGAHVVCLDRPDDGDALGEWLGEIQGDALLVDVTAPDAAESIARHLEETYGGVDIVVHNAGITRDKIFRRMPEGHWDQALEVNLGAICRITRRLLEGPLREGGRLVFLSSISGVAGNPSQTNYAASKAGVIGLARSLAPALAERGITANAVAPGFIETRLTEVIPFALREVARRMNSLGQGGKPEDVAQAVTLLASPGAQGLTGQVLRVCGGCFIGA